jgi:hypothetical protein
MRRIMLLLVAAGAVFLGLTRGVEAQSFDGTYAGTLSCPALPGGMPLRTEFFLTVSGTTANYEREIRRPGTAGGHTGTYERGRGTVAPSGDVAIRGACEGNATCDAEYRGQLTSSPIRLSGTQRWRVRDRVESRDCEIELAPRPRS